MRKLIINGTKRKKILLKRVRKEIIEKKKKSKQIFLKLKIFRGKTYHNLFFLFIFFGGGGGGKFLFSKFHSTFYPYMHIHFYSS